MKSIYKLLIVLAIISVSSQADAMLRLSPGLSGRKAFIMPRIAVRPPKALQTRGTQLQRHDSRRFAGSASKGQNYNLSIFGATRKGVSQFSKARMALAGTVGLTAAGLALYEKPTKSEDKSTVPWQVLKDKIVHELKAEEKALEKKMADFCGLSEEEWAREVDILLIKYTNNEFLNTTEAMHYEEAKKVGLGTYEEKYETVFVDPELKECVEQSLKAHGFNPNAIEIVTNFAFSDNAAVKLVSVNQQFEIKHKIIIGYGWISYFNQSPENKKELLAVLQHEIQHMLNQDALKKSIYTTLLLRAFNIKRENCDRFAELLWKSHAPKARLFSMVLLRVLSKTYSLAHFAKGFALWKSYSQFCEKRADILAASENTKTALFLASHYSKDTNDIRRPTTHPLSAKRCEYLMDIYRQSKDAQI